MKFIRVISDIKRWDRIPSKPDTLPADCFADIKTTHNTLSLWKLDEEHLNELVTIATMGRTSLAKITYVLLDEEELKALGVTPKQDAPNCSYINPEKKDFTSYHYDVIDIDHELYIRLALLLIDKVKASLKLLNKKEVEAAAIKLCSNKIVLENRLQESMRKCLTP